jgi:tRNA(fMet)-specific endonuclease VapC
MPGKLLLDAGTVIALFGGNNSARKLVADSDLFVPSVVLGELQYGARRTAQVVTNLARIDELAGSVPVLACSATTARYYAQIKESLRSKGRLIPENDIWVAAVAQEHGLPLATRDRHFKEVSGLKIERW